MVKDPFKNCNFKIEINGVMCAYFTDCTGLNSQVAAIEHREGGSFGTIKVPGKVTYSDITLKWGLTDNKDLYNWHKNIINGIVDRRNGSIILYDDVIKEEKARWNFFKAWPIKWEAPTLNAKSAEIAIESITICCEWVERVS